MKLSVNLSGIKNPALCAFIFLISWNLAGQTRYNSTIDLSVKSPETINKFFLSYLEITQHFYVENLPDDSITLALKNAFPFQTSLIDPETGKNAIIPEMSVYIKSQAAPDFIKPDFYFNGVELVIPVIYSDFEILLTYDYFSVPIGLTDTYDLVAYMSCYLPFLNDWYFGIKDMEEVLPLSISLVVPEHYLFFPISPYFKEGIYHFIKPQSSMNTNFFIIDERFFETSDVSVGPVDIKLLFTKGFVILNSDTIVPGSSISDEIISKRTEGVGSMIVKVNDYFNNKEKKKITIADTHLRNGELSSGYAHETNKNEYFILIDSLFWDTSALMHEIIHCFVRNDYAELDSARFLFLESLVEYLSVILFYSDKEQIREVFEDKIKNYTFLKNDNTSTLSISKNMGSENRAIIYDQVPYLIYKFAEEIGDGLMQIIIHEFYQNACIANRLLFDDFRKTAIANGVSQEKWQQFEEGL